MRNLACFGITFSIALGAMPASVAAQDTNVGLQFAGPVTFAAPCGKGKSDPCPEPPPEDDTGGDTGGDTGSSGRTPVYFPWMSPLLDEAWALGGSSPSDFVNLGQTATITVVDDFASKQKLFGNLDGARERLRHGEWTLKQAGLVAPHATMIANEVSNAGAVVLTSGFDVLNLSYGWIGTAAPVSDGLNVTRDLEKSIIDAATGGSLYHSGDTAVVVKSAGNESTSSLKFPVGIRSHGHDYLAIDLINALTDETVVPIIFAGALDYNNVGSGTGTGSYDAVNDAWVGAGGTLTDMSSYSNVAGDDPLVQQHFVSVGVESGTTGLAGTSFSAPILSGYAAVLQSKFHSTATPGLVVDRILKTANRKGLADYVYTSSGTLERTGEFHDVTVQGAWDAADSFVYGRGEANILHAISPDGIN